MILSIAKIAKSRHPQNGGDFTDTQPEMTLVSAKNAKSTDRTPIHRVVSAFGAVFADTCPVLPPVSAFEAVFTDRD